MKNASKTFSPAVLIVDDDLSVRRRLRRKFHEETSVGVIVSKSLSEAREIIEDSKMDLDAIVADIVFEQDTWDPDHKILDGIDLLTYSQKKRPNLPQYVISCWADLTTYHERADKLGLKIESWFQKLDFGESHKVLSPWAQVERNIIKRVLSSDSNFKERVKELGISSKEEDVDALSERTRYTLMPTMRTYIQDIEGYIVKHPIEVFCKYIDNNQVVAHAVSLGLLQEGEGDNVEDALDSLSEIITGQLTAFEEERADTIVGYAKLVFERLKYYLARK